MRMVFMKDALLKGLQVASRIASTQKNPPILANVRIVAEDKHVVLYSTDLEIGVKEIIKGEIIEPGSITLPARKLADIVSALPDANGKGVPSIIKINTTSNDRVGIVCGKARFSLAGLPDDEFPRLAEIGSEVYSVSGKALCAILHKVAYAASTSETKAFLCGVYLTAKDECWQAVATDGKRLAIARHKDGNTIPANTGVIIPLTEVSAILKLFSDCDEVKLEISDNQILIADDTLTMTGRLLNAEYPDYSVFIEPTRANKISITAETQRLVSALRRVSLLANTKTPAVKFVAEDDKLVIRSNTPELGNAQDTMPVAIEGGGIEMAFNASYMLDILAGISTEAVLIKLLDPTRPILVKEPESDDYICIAMPMKPDVLD